MILAIMGERLDPRQVVTEAERIIANPPNSFRAAFKDLREMPPADPDAVDRALAKLAITNIIAKHSGLRRDGSSRKVISPPQLPQETI